MSELRGDVIKPQEAAAACHKGYTKSAQVAQFELPRLRQRGDDDDDDDDDVCQEATHIFATTRVAPSRSSWGLAGWFPLASDPILPWCCGVHMRTQVSGILS